MLKKAKGFRAWRSKKFHYAKDAVVMNGWKLIHSKKVDQWELYRLDEDGVRRSCRPYNRSPHIGESGAGSDKARDGGLRRLATHCGRMRFKTGRDDRRSQVEDLRSVWRHCVSTWPASSDRPK